MPPPFTDWNTGNLCAAEPSLRARDLAIVLGPGAPEPTDLNPGALLLPLFPLFPLLFTVLDKKVIVMARF